MDRRDFSKQSLLLGLGVLPGSAKGAKRKTANQPGNYYKEPPKNLPVRKFDVVVAGAGTAGVVAALAAARQGAKTMLIEWKGYPGGTSQKAAPEGRPFTQNRSSIAPPTATSPLTQAPITESQTITPYATV